ncbi:MAG: nitrate reductase NapAB chaperone NapD [Candidatus Latescibacterota bacterium]|jgi:nitrate reductase NapAB chaperone NapD|tara:strand:- start:142 stop:429 length:288 start_codon:yes stop_codon:yes gene_type:complete
MPICSYIVFPHPGKKNQLARELDAIAGCQTQRAEGEDLLLLLTETSSKKEEKALLDHLESVRDIQCLVLSFGALDEEAPAVSAAAIGDTHESVGS